MTRGDRSGMIKGNDGGCGASDTFNRYINKAIIIKKYYKLKIGIEVERGLRVPERVRVRTPALDQKLDSLVPRLNLTLERLDSLATLLAEDIGRRVSAR